MNLMKYLLSIFSILCTLSSFSQTLSKADKKRIRKLDAETIYRLERDNLRLKTELKEKNDSIQLLSETLNQVSISISEIDAQLDSIRQQMNMDLVFYGEKPGKNSVFFNEISHFYLKVFTTAFKLELSKRQIHPWRVQTKELKKLTHLINTFSDYLLNSMLQILSKKTFKN